MCVTGFRIAQNKVLVKDRTPGDYLELIMSVFGLCWRLPVTAFIRDHSVYLSLDDVRDVRENYY